MANTYLTRTPSSTGNRRTFTISVWVKRARIGSPESHITNINTGNNPYARILFKTDDTLKIEDYDGNQDTNIVTNRKFRDTNAWYHIVVAYDTTQSTASNRVKLYVNGVQETSFSASTYPAQNFDTEYNNQSKAMEIGRYSSNYFEGCMSHFHIIDGTQYAASTFGSTDSTTGEWKINTSPNVTYGTNGAFILKDGNSVTDQSPNTNNYTVGGGTLTKTEDNPSNIFCTLNPLSFNTSWTLSNGNNTFNGGTVTDWKYGCAGTLGASSGKYYWEAKWTSGDSYSIVGVLPIDQYWRCAKGDTSTDVYGKSNSLQLSASNTGDKYNYVSSNGSGIQRTINDILMFAIDFDNKKMWVGENGTWDSSGNPATGANPTWDTSEFNSDWDSGFVPFCQSYKISAVTEFQFNFGNGYFGTTAISSEGTNASGIGKFEYDVPTGFTALSTKGLNE